MSSAGQANEAGSVFRRDAALHFAVHALAGVHDPAVPVATTLARIDFETTDATDDIRLTYQDGTRVYASAKRKAGLDKHTRDTAAGWVRQATELGEHDQLVLAAAETSGPLRDLQHALNRLRTGAGVTRRSELRALKWLDDLVPAKLRALIRQRAHVVELAHTATNFNEQNLLVAMLNTVVADEQGAAALSCLAEHLHTLAGAGSGSGVEQWLAELKGLYATMRGRRARIRVVKGVFHVTPQCSRRRSR